MFGLTKLELTLVASLALVLAIAIGLWRFGYIERKAGAQECKTADVQAVQVQENHDAKADTDALKNLQDQNLALADWIAKHPPSAVIVRRGPACSTQGATVAGSGQAADVPAAASSGVREPDSIDIGPRVRLIAEVAFRASAIATACEVDVAARSASR